MSSETETLPYSVLADIYDQVMSDVDYETWADYLDEIILTHHPNALSLLELACGTGNIALTLEELDQYNIKATDLSESMIRVAKTKGVQISSAVDFQVMDFLEPDIHESFDVIYMTFDSLNYLHKEQEILRLHDNAKRLLNRDGIFIYDFTTPRNSRKAIQFLNYENRTLENGIRFSRNSTYDAKLRVHSNEFLIEKESTFNRTEIYREVHLQKIYTLGQITEMIRKTEFTILDAYNSFTLEPATDLSLRVTMVLQ
ncbi:MAG: class I SAM-dependent methyltransferase [Balneolaceae bacterium]|nr:MAG: class I SAM-dependent methyltransferase [Balneolaceae bacterium]